MTSDASISTVVPTFTTVGDKHFEALLSQFGVKPQLGVVNLNEINHDESVDWNGRSIGLMADHVDRIRDAIASGGAIVPRIAVATLPNGRTVVLSGNHRVAAMRANGVTQAEAYFVNGLPELKLRELGSIANLAHGQRLDETSRDDQFMFAYRKGERDINWLCRIFNISRERGGKLIKRQELREMLTRKGIKGLKIGRLTGSHLDQIGRVASYDESLATTVCKKIIDTGMSANQAKTMIDDASAAADVEKREQMIASYDPSSASRGAKARGNNQSLATARKAKMVFEFLESGDKMVALLKEVDGQVAIQHMGEGVKAQWQTLRGHVDELFA